MSTAGGDEPVNTADELTQLRGQLALMQRIHALQLNIPATATVSAIPVKHVKVPEGHYLTLKRIRETVMIIRH